MGPAGVKVLPRTDPGAGGFFFFFPPSSQIVYFSSFYRVGFVASSPARMPVYRPQFA